MTSAKLAFEPVALKEALLRELSGTDLLAAQLRAREDLLSADFMPGRGLLDMKGAPAAPGPARTNCQS